MLVFYASTAFMFAGITGSESFVVFETMEPIKIFDTIYTCMFQICICWKMKSYRCDWITFLKHF